ncbi:MAG: DUF2442 domain-containing protein [Verrucomicrobia bacterium]|nr:DUF2442 domain-containing protein [Verrucomicrobiota bacterium]
MKRITFAEPLPGYRVRLRFDDGVEGVVDLSAEVGKGVFAAWKDVAHFKRVRIGEFGELLWDGEIDLCPDALYMEVTGATVEQLFPNWKSENVHA